MTDSLNISWIVIRWKMAFKRMVKRPAYLALWVLFPLVIWLVPGLNQAASDQSIQAGYVMEEQNRLLSEREEAFLQQIEAGLQKESGLFQYLPFEDRAELERRIRTGEISCGVIFGEEFSENMARQDFRRCILIEAPEGMNLAGMVQEDVFRTVYQVYGAGWLRDRLAEKGYEVKEEEILDKLEEYREKGALFAVEYTQIEEENSVQPDSGNGEKNALLSLRSVLAFMTLMSAVMGALDISRDRGRRAGKGMHGQFSMYAVTAAAPVIIAVAFLLLGTKMTNVSETILYGLALWLLALLIGRLIPEKILGGLIPCFLMVVLVCCPVFFDLGERIPFIGAVSKLFPITWYLR